MCVTCDIGNLELIASGRKAADNIIEGYLHIPIEKAMNLGTPRGFDRAVAALSTNLHAQTKASDAEAVRAAISVLDVNWATTTAEQRNRLISQAMLASGRATAGVPATVESILGPEATEVVEATRTAARRNQRLAIAADFNALDYRIVNHLRISQTSFVRDEYGRRNAAFSERARQIVSDGLEAGLGQNDIARDLEQAAQNIIAGQSSFYWDVVSGSFIGQGRSFSQLSAYAEAGIERYLIEAILDERTTETCRFLHGKTFTVSTGLQTFERIEAEPDQMTDIVPWVREGRDQETDRKALYVERDGERIAVTEVVRSGFGSPDDQGEFSRSLSERDLIDLGISFPPFHGLCRSTTLPV